MTFISMLSATISVQGGLLENAIETLVRAKLNRRVTLLAAQAAFIQKAIQDFDVPNSDWSLGSAACPGAARTRAAAPHSCRLAP
ncbi:hypothetical protein [uncultured Microbacterium sp.]|uniref:hypothetical protein n=1 Tax=uncultured Microbacterium sp. TaxID=191216 RepID=UPI0025FF4835|nr:hypothetical protein [uncultured Microbacterium sp.]